MSETCNQNTPPDMLAGLLLATPEQLLQEQELSHRGFLPERHGLIIAAEQERLTTEARAALNKRVAEYPEGELEKRSATVRTYLLEDSLNPPSFPEPDSPYAARWHRNLLEALDKIVDINQDEDTVPPPDERLTAVGLFHANSFHADGILWRNLVNDIQSALPPEERFTDYQLNDYFTNISPNQLRTVAERVAQSGLTLYEESFTERYRAA